MSKVITIHLTADNAVTEILPGDILTDCPDLGTVTSVRLTRDGHENLKVYGNKGGDIIGLPQTVRVTR